MRLTPSKRQFLRRVYGVLLLAVLVLVALETALFASGAAPKLARFFSGTNWLLVLCGYMIVSYLASGAARKLRSTAAQLSALIVYVVAKAVIFVPLLYWAERSAPGTIGSAAAATVFGFISLTAVVWWSGKEFDFLRPLLVWGGLCALVAILVALLTPFRLGVWFSVAMVVYAGAAVLYRTDKVLRRYRKGREVAAGLELFAAIALMFWYAVRLLRRVRS
ncbi:MAG: Bax inhibitor-1 family protein [Acidobacteriota bacterium]